MKLGQGRVKTMSRPFQSQAKVMSPWPKMEEKDSDVALACRINSHLPTLTAQYQVNTCLLSWGKLFCYFLLLVYDLWQSISLLVIVELCQHISFIWLKTPYCAMVMVWSWCLHEVIQRFWTLLSGWMAIQRRVAKTIANKVLTGETLYLLITNWLNLIHPVMFRPVSSHI